MKKYILLVISMFLILGATGCEKYSGNNSDYNNPTTTTKQLDHKVYKYTKMTCSSGNELFINLNYLFDYIDRVGYAETDYDPTLIVETDTNTGKAINATLYGYFLDYGTDEWVDKAIEKYNTSSSNSKKDILSVDKGRVNDQVTYIKIRINPDSYNFEQYIQSYIMREQDIDTYKKKTYYDQLYNYSTTPEKEEGDNYFYNGLTSIRLEWSDDELRPLL